MTQNPIVFEEADTPALLSELAALAHVIWQQHYVPIIGQAQVDYMLARSYSDTALARDRAAGGHFTLARRDDRSVGFSAISPPDSPVNDMAWLDKLYVLQDARNLGIGRQLVMRAAEQAKRLWQVDHLALRVNRHNDTSIAAYRAIGFDIEDSDCKDIGDGFVMDDYIMAAPLTRLMQPPAGPHV